MLSVVIPTTESDIESIKMIENRVKLTEILWIEIPDLEIEIPHLEFTSPVSPTDSEFSSGFGSLSPRFQTSTPIFSPTTPEFDTSVKNIEYDFENSFQDEIKEYPEDTPIQVMYGGRDILNLGANLEEPSWHGWNPIEPYYGMEAGPTTNHSVRFRLEEKDVFIEDFLTKVCSHCGFAEPFQSF